MNARQKKEMQAKLNALSLHLDATEGPVSCASLARSYGLDEPKVAEILQSRGRYSA